MEPRNVWVDPPLAAWARANAQLEADRLRAAIAIDWARGVHVDETLASLSVCWRRLTVAQQEIVAMQIYERE